MSGHSKFKNIQYRKGAQDKKRATLFSKLAREITVATKEGGSDDPNSNSRLRLALTSAKVQSMPKVNIDRAIAKGMGSSGGNEHYENILYEGYGPGKVVVLVEAMTNNRNRAISDIRTLFSKSGGGIAGKGSLSFLFDYIGYIEYESHAGTFDVFEESCILAGAEDIEQEGNSYIVTTKDTTFHQVLDYLHKEYGDPLIAKLIWKPKQFINIDEKTMDKLLYFFDQLDDNEDVQHVFSNALILHEIS